VRLTRALAESGHYPAVDVLESVSRVAPAIVSDEVLRAGSRVRELLAAWRDARDLIEIDAYVPGTNAVVDRAVARKPAIDAFLRQPVTERSDLTTALAGLLALAADEEAAP
jgi:flagellum-specific ATP synthase